MKKILIFLLITTYSAALLAQVKKSTSTKTTPKSLPKNDKKCKNAKLSKDGKTWVCPKEVPAQNKTACSDLVKNFGKSLIAKADKKEQEKKK